VLPHPFAYHRPETIAEALELFERFDGDAAFYAGGTELLLALKARVLRYDHLIDLKRIPGLSGVREDGGIIVIGALSTHHQLSCDPLICDYLPAYAALSGDVANIRVRSAGTLGGNLCFAEPHADPPALLAAMGAEIVLQGTDGERTVSAGDFIESEFTTAKAENEILTEIRVPKPAAGARFAFRSFGHLERPAVSVATGFVPGEGRFRLWVGAIADRPQHLAELEEMLNEAGPGAVDDVLSREVERIAGDLPAITDLHGSADYKRSLAATHIRRCVREVVMDQK